MKIVGIIGNGENGRMVERWNGGKMMNVDGLRITKMLEMIMLEIKMLEIKILEMKMLEIKNFGKSIEDSMKNDEV